jgi:uncharacterized surface protein with fasciclin (FAS1) repeats
MSPAGIFAMGVLVTLIFGSGLSLLVYGAILDGRDEARRKAAERERTRVGTDGNHPKENRLPNLVETARGGRVVRSPAPASSAPTSRPPSGSSTSSTGCCIPQPPESSERTSQMKRITSMLALLVVAIAASAFGASASTGARTQGNDNIVNTAVAAGQFTTLASLLGKAGLVETLQGAGPFTVFAPTDAAFAKVPQATLDALAADPAKLKSVLLYHVVAGKALAADVVKLTSAKTLEGRSVAIKVVDGSVFLDGAKVTTPDVTTSNGVIHVIDSVLLPKEAVAAKPKTIVQTATAAGTFKTLTSLLTKAGLASTLRGKGPFTVFAPTDAAFAKVPKATLTALGKDRAKLRAVLLYHVVKGNVPATRVVKLSTAKTLNGQSVGIRVTGGKVFVDGARVTATDVKASNGLIHVVNRVLIP